MLSDTQINIPYFSIVIPVYNREREILRALNSCLSQSFTNIEVVVVDDASKDNTSEAVRSVNDSRVVLVTHEKNRGVCPTRNTGIAKCSGDWVLFLDSDDELLPGAIQKIYEKTLDCPRDIERLGFVYCFDNGRFSPEPIPKDCVLDYEAYVAWSASIRPSDFFHCTRSHAFEKVRFSESRAYESSYLLDFAKHFRTWMIPEIVAIIHTDSDNRDNNITDQELMNKFIREAKDEAAAMEYILENHGKVLSVRAPKRYRLYRKAKALFYFLSGLRWEGTKAMLEYLKSFPVCLEGWSIWLAGLIGPRTLARFKVWKLRALTDKREKTVKV